MDSIINLITSFGSTVATIVFFIFLYMTTSRIMSRQMVGQTDKAMIRQIVLFLIAMTGIIAVILALPLSTELKGQISSLIGIVISAVFAISSATFIGNMLAGILLRTVSSFKPGDFITVEDTYGRVSERGLFHTEIQTINRDLITLPNLYIATNPVKVTRSSGTFISATCSLGYDVNRLEIEKALIKAAKESGLKDPFVLITELGDFSIVYKVHGLLEDVKRVLTARSQLYAQVLDCLHAAGIEIVSPNFMNQRQVGDTVFIPKKVRMQAVVETEAPEAVIFDKADKAQNIEDRKTKLTEIEDKIKNLQTELTTATDDTTKADLEKRISRWKTAKEKMMQNIDTKIDEMQKDV